MCFVQSFVVVMNMFFSDGPKHLRVDQNSDIGVYDDPYFEEIVLMAKD